MIIGDNRDKVIENIKCAVQRGEFNVKVELDDPVLNNEERTRLLDNYFHKKRRNFFYAFKNATARNIIRIFSVYFNRSVKIKGMSNIKDIKGGAVVTSNHFSQLDNLIVRRVARKAGKRTLYIISQETNFAMTGIVGFLMNYADTIPLCKSSGYISQCLEPILERMFNKSRFILIYPEQEMWFNYRKPRPLKRGAYVFAAKNNVPVVSCFVEIRDRKKMDTAQFHKVKYIMHVLPPIYPDKDKTVRENSIEMCRIDYEQKKNAYEEAYGKKLDYKFEDSDIAGRINL